MSVDQVAEYLTVSKLGARAGVRPDTIRYYERSGLLPAPRRTDGDHRRYGPADVDRLLFIRGAQRLGLRLAEIRELLAVRDTGTCPCGEAEMLLRSHVTEIDQEMTRLAVLRAELTGMLAAMPGPECPRSTSGSASSQPRQQREAPKEDPARYTARPSPDRHHPRRQPAAPRRRISAVSCGTTSNRSPTTP